MPERSGHASCDLNIDNTAAELELQVPQSAVTLLNYPNTKLSFTFKCCKYATTGEALASAFSSFFVVLTRSDMENTQRTHTHTLDVAISFVRASSPHCF